MFPDPLRFAKALRRDPAGLARLGPFQLAGGLRGSRAQVTFDTELTGDLAMGPEIGKDWKP